MKKLEDQKELIYRFFDENEKALMLILDACNWKALRLLRNWFNIKVVRSRGSWTVQWLQYTFDEPLKDVVYVSANPYTYLLRNFREKFKRVIDLPLLCWDSNYNTVHPRSVNMFVKERVKVGDKKLIAHYMQPHPPFIFETWLNNFSHDFRNGKRELRVYELARKSFDIRREFVKAYMKNLEITMVYIESLIETIKRVDPNFKIVITSDHSEILHGAYHPLRVRRKFWLWIPWILGIYRFVGHERNSILMKELYEVPWVTF